MHVDSLHPSLSLCSLAAAQVLDGPSWQQLLIAPLRHLEQSSRSQPKRSASLPALLESAAGAHPAACTLREAVERSAASMPGKARSIDLLQRCSWLIGCASAILEAGVEADAGHAVNPIVGQVADHPVLRAAESTDGRNTDPVATGDLQRGRAHDVFDDDHALQRQLAHENKGGIGPQEYASIALDCAVPDGWQLEDRFGIDGGMQKLRTTLTGPNGESGMIVRSFDGATLYLDKAYKSTLPSRLEAVPGFARPLSTIHYLTARACRLLGVTPANLQQIKVNRLQHRATLAHLDWLQRRHPGKSLPELIDHTTWARSYIRETAGIFGHALQPAPRIDREGTPAWLAAHPGAPRRDWDYMSMETERLMIKHLTGAKLPQVDDAGQDWRAAAQSAVARYRERRCSGLTPAAAALEAGRIDDLLATRLAAIRREESQLRKRYDLAPGATPRVVNFDVTFRTASSDLRAQLR